MKLFTIMSLLLSYILTLSSHPMALIIIISTQTLVASIIISMSTPSAWFSYILFLVFMGGLMVLFIYVSSLASNEKFNVEVWWNPMNSFFLLVTVTISTFLAYNYQTIKILLNSPQTLIIKVYTVSTSPIIMLTMLFLLLVLIIAVNITTLKEGSLRQLK